MPLDGEYEPGPDRWVREQVERCGATDGREAGTLGDTRRPVVIVTTRGNKSGLLRKTPLMRVEHDGADRFDAVARELSGEERAVWWQRADPPSAEYQTRTERQIPVFLAGRRQPREEA